MSVPSSSRNHNVWGEKDYKGHSNNGYGLCTIRKRFEFTPKTGKMAVVRSCSFGNDKFPRHVFMPFATEIITMKGESTCLFGDELNPGNFPRQDIGADSQVGTVEAVEPVKGSEFQRYGHTLFQGDPARIIFVSFGCYLDNLSGTRKRKKTWGKDDKANGHRTDDDKEFFRRVHGLPFRDRVFSDGVITVSDLGFDAAESQTLVGSRRVPRNRCLFRQGKRSRQWIHKPLC